LIITYGSSGESLARKIASISGMRIAETTRRRFPDGELYLRVEDDVSGEDAAVVQSLGLNPDALFMEYSLLVDALRGAGCRSVTGIIPYMAYARQDSRFRRGEPLSTKQLARLIESSGTDRLVTVDMHLHRLKDMGSIFRIPAANLSAMPLLADYYRRNYDLSRTVVVGPDSESEQWAKIIAEGTSVGYTILKKERLGDREVSISGSLPVEGRRVVLVDDMISTGRTLTETISKLRVRGVTGIDVLTTHALLVEGAYERLKDAGMSTLIATDTVPGPHSLVSVAPLIAKALEVKVKD